MSASLPPPISTRTEWKGVPYRLDVWQRRNDKVEASLWHVKENDDNEDELVGYIQGYLLERPSGDFCNYFDGTSEEFRVFGIMMCEMNGVARRKRHHLHEQSAIRGGGFLNIEKIEIKPCLRGNDLGLWMLHNLLWNLSDRWTLCVWAPKAWTKPDCRWPENSKMAWPKDAPALTDKQEALWHRNTFKVARHFARMGFRQVGETAMEAEVWFLTKEGLDRQKSAPCPLWIDSSQVHKLGIREPKEKRALQKHMMEQKFLLAVKDFPSNARLTMETYRSPSTLNENMAVYLLNVMEEMSRCGISVDRSRALHLAVRHSKPRFLLRFLLDLGADVNHPDHESGNTPLHFAAGETGSYGTIMNLLEWGANPRAKNDKGETPFQMLLSKLEKDAPTGFLGQKESLDPEMPAVVYNFQKNLHATKMQCIQALLPQNPLCLPQFQFDYSSREAKRVRR